MYKSLQFEYQKKPTYFCLSNADRFEDEAKKARDGGGEPLQVLLQ